MRNFSQAFHPIWITLFSSNSSASYGITSLHHKKFNSLFINLFSLSFCIHRNFSHLFWKVFLGQKNFPKEKVYKLLDAFYEPSGFTVPFFRGKAYGFSVSMFSLLGESFDLALKAGGLENNAPWWGWFDSIWCGFSHPNTNQVNDRRRQTRRHQNKRIKRNLFRGFSVGFSWNAWYNFS